MEDSFLHDISSHFGVTFQNVSEPPNTFIPNVFILDQAYVLKGRIKDEGREKQIHEEYELLRVVEESVPFSLPLLLPTKEGKPFHSQSDRLWTLGRYLPGKPLGSWQEPSAMSDTQTKDAMEALRALHDRTRDGHWHEYVNLNDFVEERKKQLADVHHLLPPHVSQRISIALDRVRESRLPLSPKDLCFIHGDFHQGNIIVNKRGEISGLIDFDFCRIGHPFEDLGITVFTFLHDYRLPSFSFHEDYFHQLLEWYGIHKEDHSLFSEYLLVASLFVVWDFFRAQGVTKNSEYYLQYDLSMIHGLCERFTSREHHASIHVPPPLAQFPVALPEKYIALAHELGIDPKKVKERFVRGSGHGGQKINKTSNCVELSYGSPAITVRIQEFREQHKNRQRAWKLLIEKFEGKWKLKESKKELERYKIRKQKGRRSRKAKEKMLKEKKHRGETKRRRKEFLD